MNDAQAIARAKAFSQRIAEGASTLIDPTVPLVLKGEKYLLEFTNLQAIKLLEDTGFNVLTDPLDQKRCGDIKFITTLLYYGLKNNRPEVTVEEAGRIFSLKYYNYIITQLREALRGYLPDLSDMVMDDDNKDEVSDTDPIKQL